MPPKYSSQTRKKSGTKKWATLIVIILLAAGGGIYWRLKIYKPASEIVKTAGISPSFKIKNNTSTSTTSPKKSTSDNGQQITTGTDTNGKATSTTNSSQWITSTSGVITVEQPIANATVQSGNVLSGAAKVSAVSYTLIDNSVGVISQGTLQVVNGKFSGTLNFTPHASSGQLDVYSTGSNGVELNEIQISINF
jgi:hypothetical protein